LGIHVNRNVLKQNVLYHLKAYADDVNILKWSINILKENARYLIAATLEVGFEVIADKCKYIVMSREQIARRI